MLARSIQELKNAELTLFVINKQSELYMIFTIRRNLLDVIVKHSVIHQRGEKQLQRHDRTTNAE